MAYRFPYETGHHLIRECGGGYTSDVQLTDDAIRPICMNGNVFVGRHWLSGHGAYMRMLIREERDMIENIDRKLYHRLYNIRTRTMGSISEARMEAASRLINIECISNQIPAYAEQFAELIDMATTIIAKCVLYSAALGGSQ